MTTVAAAGARDDDDDDGWSVRDVVTGLPSVAGEGGSAPRPVGLAFTGATACSPRSASARTPRCGRRDLGDTDCPTKLDTVQRLNLRQRDGEPFADIGAVEPRRTRSSRTSTPTRTRSPSRAGSSTSRTPAATRCSRSTATAVVSTRFVFPHEDPSRSRAPRWAP